MTEDRIVRRAELQRLTGLSRSSIYARMSSDSKMYDVGFPKPVKIGPRAVGWRLSEIRAWLDSRARVEHGGGKR